MQPKPCGHGSSNCRWLSIFLESGFALFERVRIHGNTSRLEKNGIEGHITDFYCFSSLLCSGFCQHIISVIWHIQRMIRQRLDYWVQYRRMQTIGWWKRSWLLPMQIVISLVRYTSLFIQLTYPNNDKSLSQLSNLGNCAFRNSLLRWFKFWWDTTSHEFGYLWGTREQPLRRQRSSDASWFLESSIWAPAYLDIITILECNIIRLLEGCYGIRKCGIKTNYVELGIRTFFYYGEWEISKLHSMHVAGETVKLLQRIKRGVLVNGTNRHDYTRRDTKRWAHVLFSREDRLLSTNSGASRCSLAARPSWLGDRQIRVLEARQCL